jgi:hypothetical protein
MKLVSNHAFSRSFFRTAAVAQRWLFSRWDFTARAPRWPCFLPGRTLRWPLEGVSSSFGRSQYEISIFNLHEYPLNIPWIYSISLFDGRSPQC